jgi:hypothetical protein
LSKNIDNLEDVKKTNRSLLFLWAAMIFAPYLYTWLARNIELEPHPYIEIHIAVPILLAMVAYAISTQFFYYFRFMKGKGLFPKNANTQFLEKKNALTRMIRQADLKDLPIYERGLKVLLKLQVSTHIIMWSCGLSFAVGGIMMTYITGDLRWVDGLAVVSIANLFLFFPRSTSYQRRVQDWNEYLRSETKG